MGGENMSVLEMTRIVEDLESTCSSLESFLINSEIKAPNTDKIKNVLTMFPMYYKAKQIAEKRLWTNRHASEKIRENFDKEHPFVYKGFSDENVINIVEKYLQRIVSKFYKSGIFYIKTTKNDNINKIEGPIKKISSDLNEFIKVLVSRTITNLQYLARHGANGVIRGRIDDMISKFYQLGTGLNMSNYIIKETPDYCKLIFEIVYSKDKNTDLKLFVSPLDIIV